MLLKKLTHIVINQLITFYSWWGEEFDIDCEINLREGNLETEDIVDRARV